MFTILSQTFKTGVVTTAYPVGPANVSESFRGRPHFDFDHWHDARPAAAACPTGAISVSDRPASRTVCVDYGLCVFCGLCAEAGCERAVRITQEFDLAVENRQELIASAEYDLNPDGSQRALIALNVGAPAAAPAVERVGHRLKDEIASLFGRSLAIREVDAGSCNGCELEIGALNNPIYDIERFGVHFVASPRHADMLLVTGPVTRNMELALQKSYRATPEPRLVVAAGTCGISGGVFGKNYASLGGVDQVIPVDIYVPGCPPRPQALLQGILIAIRRAGPRSAQLWFGPRP